MYKYIHKKYVYKKYIHVQNYICTKYIYEKLYLYTNIFINKYIPKLLVTLKLTSIQTLYSPTKLQNETLGFVTNNLLKLKKKLH